MNIGKEKTESQRCCMHEHLNKNAGEKKLNSEDNLLGEVLKLNLHFQKVKFTGAIVQNK